MRYDCCASKKRQRFSSFSPRMHKAMSLPLVNNPAEAPFVRGDMKLSDNEKKVYNVLLKLTGPVKVSRIAEWSGLPRTTAEYIIKKFVHAKIAHTKLSGK